MQLWDHQVVAMEFLLKRQASGLFMDMGTGKSAVALELVRNSLHRFVLIVMPKNVLIGQVWQQEMKRVYVGDPPIPPYTVVSLDSGTTNEKSAKVKQIADIIKARSEYAGLVFVLVNYDSVWRKPLADAILRAPFDCIILDEAHRIKAAGSKVSKYFAMLARHLYWARRLALTGTPAPNSPLDVYGLCRFIDPTVFGTNFDKFQSRYAVMGGPNNYIVKKYINLDELHNKLASISFRVTSEVLDLPEAVHITRSTRFIPAVQRMYDEFQKEMILEVNNDTVIADNVLVKILKLQQMTSGFIRWDYNEEEQIDTSKLDLFTEVLDDLPVRERTDGTVGKEPVVVFARFIRDLHNIHQRALDAGYRVSELSGRKKELLQWQSGETDLLIVQIQSGSEGISLTRARYAIYFSNLYNLGTYQQSISRLHRPGQKDTAFFIHLVVKDSIDEDIEESLRTKKNIIDILLGRYRTATVPEQ